MDAFSDPQVVMMGKVLLAAVLGFILGTERAVVAKQAAGSRTFALVAMGACVFVISGSFVNSQFIGLVNFDPSRVIAAVVQGIGFLGAGLIIFRRDTLRGVTTAAGLWVAAGVGAVVAVEMYSVAIFVTILTLAIFLAVWHIENRFKHWFHQIEDTVWDESHTS
jgi:putative Mg2+ transporter-C (MgtC) family protein